MIFQLYLLVAIATSDSICSNDLIVSASEPSESDTKNDVIINNGKPMKTFIPTKEWQVVHDDEAIPAGLHVRMNFQTGVKEAKLLEGDTKNEDKNIIAPKEILETKEDQKNENIGPKIIMSEESKPLHEFVKDDEKIYFTKSHLKEALKEFRDKVGNKDVEEISWNEKDLEGLVPNQNVKKKFRSIEEIRDELEDSMGWKIKSDVQIMKDHLSILENDDVAANEIGTMLDNLEYYVHQIDNGKDLVRINGILPIVLLLNQTDEVLQQKAANVIGAAAQSNREVQNSIVNNGGLTLLMRMLNAKKLPLTKKKGLYALSAVVRGNTNAQQKLSRFDGFSRILQIINDERNGALRVKAVTLLSDLIVEQREQIEKLVKQGKKNQLDKFPLMDMLLQNNWCNILPPLLKADDYDTIEKILQAITVSVEPCRDAFKKHLDVWKTTNKRLSKDISSEDDQDFKSYLESLQKILKDNIMKDF